MQWRHHDTRSLDLSLWTSNVRSNSAVTTITGYLLLLFVNIIYLAKNVVLTVYATPSEKKKIVYNNFFEYLIPVKQYKRTNTVISANEVSLRVY